MTETSIKDKFSYMAEISRHKILILKKNETLSLIGYARTPKDHNRIKQKIFSLNQLARPLGNRLAYYRADSTLIINSKNDHSLRRLIDKLNTSRSATQQSLGLILEGKITNAPGPDLILKKFIESQLDHALKTGSQAGKILPGLSLHSIWIDPPFNTGKITPSLTAPQILMNHLAHPQSLGVVLGESGGGKSSLMQFSFSLLAKKCLSSAPIKEIPILIHASSLVFDSVKGTIVWNQLPGAATGCSAYLDALMDEGRLILFIDGLDENPGLLDFNNPHISQFWQAASKNKIIISCRERFWETRTKKEHLVKLFDPKNLLHLRLQPWNAQDIKNLYQRISTQLKELSLNGEFSLIGHLSGLPAAKLDKLLGSIQRTPFVSMAYLLFFIHNQGNRLPKNDFELLEHVFRLLVNWETQKPESLLHPDTARGLIMCIAWKAYLKGNCTRRWHLSFDDVWKTAQEEYPFLETERFKLFSSLGNIPMLEYNGDARCFYLDANFAEFLVARYQITTMIHGDALKSREIFLHGASYHNIVRLRYMGLQNLDHENQERYLFSAKKLFWSLWEEFLQHKNASIELSMGRILQPLGHLNIDGAQKFLRQITPIVQNSYVTSMSCAIGLAYAGNVSTMIELIGRLEKNSNDRETNRSLHLFFTRTNLHETNYRHCRLDQSSDWSRVCDFLLDSLRDPTLKALRLLDLFTFCDFAHQAGVQIMDLEKYPSDDDIKRRAALAGEISRSLKTTSSLTDPLTSYAAKFEKIILKTAKKESF